MNLKDLIDAVKTAAPASAGVTGVAMTGELLAAPGLLVVIAQTAVIVIFLTRTVDTRLAGLHKAANEARGLAETLKGRLDGLHCMKRGACGNPDHDEEAA